MPDERDGLLAERDALRGLLEHPGTRYLWTLAEAENERDRKNLTAAEHSPWETGRLAGRVQARDELLGSAVYRPREGEVRKRGLQGMVRRRLEEIEQALKRPKGED